MFNLRHKDKAQNQDTERKRTFLIEKKKHFSEIKNALYEGREIILNAFKSGMFSLPPTEDTGPSPDFATHLKKWTPKEIL